jgi:hypothetical protein
MISGTILRTLQKRPSLYTRYCIDIEGKTSISCTIFNFDRFCTLDIGTISKFLFHIEYNTVLQYRDITISKVKTLMSYRISVQYRDIRISTFPLRYQRFGRYWVLYIIPGAAGRTGHVTLAAQGPPTDPAFWSSTRLDGLYSWVTVLTSFQVPAGVQLPSVAAVARRCPALVWTVCRSLWAVLISSHRSTSDLVMIHMMSVEYTISLSLVFCLDSASDTTGASGH